MKKQKKIIVLPEYCGLCGADLEGGVTCPYCGEQVIYSEEMLDAYAKEVRNANKQKKFRIAAIIVIVIVFVMAAKDLIGGSSDRKTSVTRTEEPTPTALVTETPIPTPTILVTEIPEITPTIIPTSTPTSTPKPESTKLVTKKPKKVVTHEPEPVVTQRGVVEEVTAIPEPQEVYADNICLPETMSIARGNTTQIPLEYSPSNARISIVSSNNSVAGVSGRTLIARNPGNCTITVSSGRKSARCNVIVTE